ncbi:MULTISPECIES: DNA polymerase III subunit beta [Methylococcus]|uniref:Beta sliding clamp n=1 Tax=Methylococcus capsulatus TaxID=414 RepID=A0ABZ2F7C1_METCP|nr:MULTISPECIES: DNA polymerase III subunit beta [Methylococcus]MDF9392886.1 DNA polymerase III subunit beta [Methylococcus capsulatus]
MKFRILREDLLLPLQQVIGVIERRQTLPILLNVLIEVNDGGVELTGTDLEVQLIANTRIEGAESGRFTVPARKLMDICRLLPEGGELAFEVKPERVSLQCGKSRFVLGALPAENYPSFEHGDLEVAFDCEAPLLRRAIEKTAFAMAQQDVRYYLNGLLLEIRQGRIRTVASDGHRLALFEESVEGMPDVARQIILPRKGVLELGRLLAHVEEPAGVRISANNVRVVFGSFSFAAKLVEGRYPDYERVIPKAASRVAVIGRYDLRNALTRVAVLSNEKFKGVSLEIGNGLIRLRAQNPEHEEAEDEVPAEVSGETFSVGFNASYLLDAINAVDSDSVRMSFTDANGSCLIEDLADARHRFIVMPMRL